MSSLSRKLPFRATILLMLKNQKVLVSGAEYFTDQFAINAQMDSSIEVNHDKAIAEHNSIRRALISLGIDVIKSEAPPDLQDGVYTANWALTRGNIALMSRLPNKRKGEEAYALKYLQALGFKTVTLPDYVKSFSGQGDALPCGDIVFTQSPYRTSKEAHPFLKSVLNYNKVMSLRTMPSRDSRFSRPKKNLITGWPDSPTYDIDLALAVLKWPDAGKKGLIAWCPQVFTFGSRLALKRLKDVDKIEVSKEEAMTVFALNLVSTGEAVLMNSGAPKFQAQIEAAGLKVITLDLPELKKGGGSIRCTTLTLDN
jgi:N-dimethylarginine dimethylaminohydrolase